jgi:hypothetical protein
LAIFAALRLALSFVSNFGAGLLIEIKYYRQLGW